MQILRRIFLVGCLAIGLTVQGVEPFCIQVVDRESGWPVPLVELKTVGHIRFVSDNAGIIAFDEPDLMDQEVWFDISGHGYTVPKDGFGYRGVRLKPVAGGQCKVAVDRENIAQRVGRLTGSGLFGESKKCGQMLDWRDSGAIGCDSVQTALYQNKVFWAWGDTSLAHYPLGIFNTSAAVSPLPTVEAPFPAQPPLKPPFKLFRDSKDKIRGVAPIEGEGPTWLSGTVTLRDREGREHLCSVYSKIKPPLEPYERGLCVWDDEKEEFVRTRVVWEKSTQEPRRTLPDGHPAFWTDEEGTPWVFFGDPLPRLKCKATFEAWSDPDAWEKVESPRFLTSAADGKEIRPHTGSIQWSSYRKAWIALFVQNGGKPSSLGELWYAEAFSPLGPWGKAVKVLTHDRYTFYNPRLHPELVPAESPYLLFEGTYTMTFESHVFPSARYEYNQMLYRLDLEDPRLTPAH